MGTIAIIWPLERQREGMSKYAKTPRRKQRSQSSLLPLGLIGLGALLIIGVLLAQALKPGSPSPTPVPTNLGLSIPEPGIQRVTLDVAKTAFDGKEAIFLDVRDPDSFASGHIPGAVNIPLGQIENRAKELDPEKWIIPYCT
jgi:hypothetical protein